jgi:hypothetical protein
VATLSFAALSLVAGFPSTDSVLCSSGGCSIRLCAEQHVSSWGLPRLFRPPFIRHDVRPNYIEDCGH